MRLGEVVGYNKSWLSFDCEAEIKNLSILQSKGLSERGWLQEFICVACWNFNIVSDLQDATRVVKRLRRDCSVFNNMREKATVRGRASTMVKHAKWIWLKRYLWFVVRMLDRKFVLWGSKLLIK